jgi:hypothetical protein
LSCRQRCMLMYTGNQVIPSCNNKVTAYQYVEYQCIPTNTELVSSNISCPIDGAKSVIQIDRNGLFQSYNYPILQKMNSTYRLKTNPGYIMHFYALDISLNDYSLDCRLNKITLIEDGELQGSDFCEKRTNTLIYSSCSNELDLRYVVDDDTKFSSKGVQLYIESQVRPSDWLCGKPLSTSTSRTTSTTESFSGALAEIEHDICFNSSLNHTCPSGYTFMILDAFFYGVKKQASIECGFIQGDCVQEILSTITEYRNDLPNCFISYLTKRRLAQCSDNYADYLHIKSQCVPSRPVGTTSSIQMYDICDTTTPIVSVNGIVTSPSFPTYTQTNNECNRSIIGIQDRVLKIWINEMAVSTGGVRSLNGT